MKLIDTYNKNGISKIIKIFIITLCFITLIISLISLKSPNVYAKSSSNIIVNTTAYLNLRSNAGTNYSVIDCISINTNLTVLDRTNNNWLKVKTPKNQIGYCHSDYLDIKTKAKLNTYLNLRSGPNTTHNCIKTLYPNSIVNIIRFYNNSWMKIKTSDNKIGYVCTDYNYVSFINESTTSTFSINNVEPQNKSYNITISKTSINIKVDQKLKLSATTNSGGNITWKSSNSNIATVDNSGNITGKSKGTAIITVTESKINKTATCKVTVSPILVTKITLSSNSTSLIEGQTIQLKPTINPTKAKIAYKSSNINIATINNNGLITAKKAGTCNITIYDANGGTVNITHKISIIPKNKPNITISESNISIDVGASKKLTAKSSDNSKIKWSVSDDNIISVKNGVVSALRPGYARVIVSNGYNSTECKVTVNSINNNGLYLSKNKETLSVGKTLFIKGNSQNKIWWNVSDKNIATINTEISNNTNGFIEAKSPGKVAITYTNANGNRAICILTVTAAEPIKFTYSSPNSAVKNSNVKLIAITNKNIKDVYFEVNENGNKIKIKSDSKIEDGNTYIWTGTYYTNYSGIFNYSAYAIDSNNKASTCEDGKADIYVSNKTNIKETTLEKLRASDEVINFIGEKEGFVSKVVPDTLANNIPTMGHGYVVWDGDKFYNNITRKEGYALLVSAVNKENYTKDVNNMLISNNIKFNQQQFDALVSFSYNLGTGWSYSSNLKNILLNSYSTLSSTKNNNIQARVDVYDGLNLRESYTTNSKVLDVLLPNEIVTLVDTKKYNSIWYKVKTQNGLIGYCSSTYLEILEQNNNNRDLNYINKNTLIKEVSAYHHAGSICYYGLLYRRADELEMFLYGDYKSDGYMNNYNFPNPYCISF